MIVNYSWIDHILTYYIKTKILISNYYEIQFWVFYKFLLKN